LTAEVVKTTENAYRDVQIAFANEFAIICETLGIDAYKTRELVNKCPFRDLHIPGAGVGGHCLPKDSWLLAYGVKGKYNPKFIKLARNINDTMPIHMFELVKKAISLAGLNIKNSKITVLGFAYLQNSADMRNTPALPLIQKLKKSGAIVKVHDPFVKQYGDVEITNDFKKAVKDSNCIVIVTAHRDYNNIDLKELKKLMVTPVIVDGRNVLNTGTCKSEGFIYIGVGKPI
jgi:UDP-N-acetyl-D-mannosaminuronic acid dehydrogenase